MDDYTIARKYARKASNARQSGIPFTLSLTSFKNLMRAKKCGYTKIPLTNSGGPVPEFTDITVDRIDNTKGYEKGNVIAVCHGVNQIKGNLENPKSKVGLKEIKRMLRIIEKKMS